MYRLYIALGNVYVAIILMALLACSIAIGTWIESYTDSHRQAAKWIYQNPLFGLLLGLLFVNILFSAIRRWPFRKKHLPFLCAHLGLLMVISGVLIKQFFGVQGSLYLTEGTGSHSLALTDTLALRIDKRPQSVGELPQTAYYPIERDRLGRLNPVIKAQDSFAPELEINLLRYWPHATAIPETWIKGDHVWITGQAPMKLQEQQPIGTIRQGLFLPDWHVYAWRSLDLEKDIRELFIQQARVSIVDPKTGVTLLKGRLQELLQHPSILTLEFQIDYHLEQGLQQAILCLKDKQKESCLTLPLKGPKALMLESDHAWQSPHLQLEIECPPLLAFMEDIHSTTHLIAVSRYGEIQTQLFPANQLGSLLLYDRGFGGYGVPANIALQNSGADSLTRRQALLYHRLNDLKPVLESRSLTLIPPLEKLREASNQSQTEFASNLMELMHHWESSQKWTLSEIPHCSDELTRTLKQLSWDQEPKVTLRACDWIARLFDDLDLASEESKSSLQRLSNKNWPLLTNLKQRLKNSTDEVECRRALTEQILECSSYLPESEASEQLSSVQRLTAYFRAYHFDWKPLIQLSNQENIQKLLQQWQIALLSSQPPPAWITHLHEIEREPLAELIAKGPLELETTLTTRYRAFPPSLKLEDNRPLVALWLKQGKQTEQVTLGFDPQSNLFKQPVLGGAFRVHLEWMQQELPYHLRLLDARQVVHPHSSQPLSYESKLLVTDPKTGQAEEVLLSMNQVHEAPGGYRFYLSGLAPAEEIAPRQVHLVVNQDPVRWWLTYPGAIFISLGAILLLFFRSYLR